MHGLAVGSRMAVGAALAATLITLTPQHISSIGVLLSGTGSIATASLSIWLSHKRARDECDKRIKELSRAFHAGQKFAQQQQQQQQHGTHYASDDLSDWGGG